MCFDLGQLQEYMDGESSIEQSREISVHLNTCTRCQERLEEIEQNAMLIKQKLGAWMEPSARRPDEREAILESISRRAQLGERQPDSKPPESEKPSLVQSLKNTLKTISSREVKSMLGRYRPAAAAAVVFLCLGIALSFGPVRGAAANFLAIFRADQIKTVSLDIDDLQSIERALQQGGSNIELEQFGKVEVKEDIRYVTSTMAEAAPKVDFTLKQMEKAPAGFKPPQVQYSTPASANFTLKVDNVNKILQSFKSQTMLPKELDNQTFTLSIPASVKMTFESTERQRPLNIVQSRSPELQVPDGADLDKVRQALLDLPILPEQMKRQLSAISDWQHTILIPDVNGSSRNVTVQGVPGVIMQNPDPGAAPNSGKCLIWIKDGVIYAVEGDITAEQALEAANSLR